MPLHIVDNTNKFIFRCLFIFNFESVNVGSTDSKMWKKPSSVFGRKFGGTLRGHSGLIGGKFSQKRIGRFENVERNLRASSDGNSEGPFGVATGSSKENFHRNGSGDSEMWGETFERLRTKIRRDPSGSQRVYRRKIFTGTDRKSENRQRTFRTSIRGTLTGTSDHRGRFSRERFSSPGFCPGSRGSFRPQAEI